MESVQVTVWGMLGLVFGGGALGSVLTVVSNFVLAKAKQPVDQYDQLVKTMHSMMAQEREHFEARLVQDRLHCDSKLDKLEKDLEKACEREDHAIGRMGELRQQLGRLEGRLEEQQRLLATVFKESTDVAGTAIVTAQHLMEGMSQREFPPKK